MSRPADPRDSSRRNFLGTTAAGIAGLTSGSLTARAPASRQESDTTSAGSAGAFRIMSDASIRKESIVDLHLQFQPRLTLLSGGTLWLFFDISLGGQPET